MTVTPKIEAFANAIAKAEGFGIPDKIPTKAHNPGDLVIPGWPGPRIGEGISVFSSDAEGWLRLYHELELILIKASRVYSPEMTILEMAHSWTLTDSNDWAKNVASSLGATVYTTIGPLLGGPSDDAERATSA